MEKNLTDGSILKNISKSIGAGHKEKTSILVENTITIFMGISVGLMGILLAFKVALRCYYTNFSTDFMA